MPTATPVKNARIASHLKTQLVAPREVKIAPGHKGGFVAWSLGKNSRRISEGTTVERASRRAVRKGWKVIS